jgi:hypothetical protein
MISSCCLLPFGVGMQPSDQITKSRPCDEQWKATGVDAMFRDETDIPLLLQNPKVFVVYDAEVV